MCCMLQEGSVPVEAVGVEVAGVEAVEDRGVEGVVAAEVVEEAEAAGVSDLGSLWGSLEYRGFGTASLPIIREVIL